MDRGLELVDRALAVAYETTPPNLPASANALDVRRRALYELNDYAGAVAAATECMDINQELGNSDGIGIAEFGLALALVGAGRFTEAESRARASLDRNLSSGNATGQASALWAMAQAKLAKGEVVDAMDLAARGRLTAESAQNTPLTQAIARWLESQSA